jgi:drug/metabolite transporter (DMT)-like permease
MTEKPNRTLAAAGAVLIYASLIGFTDNYVRVIAAEAGLWQFHAMRSTMAILLLGVLAVPLRLKLKPRGFRGVAARSAIHGAAMLIYFGALAFLPVAQVAAGLFTAPVFVLLIPRIVYARPIGSMQVLAVALGFGGVVLVLGPSALEGATAAAVLPVLSGALYAVGNIATREWCQDETAETLVAGFFAALGVLGVVGLIAVATVSPVADAGPDGFVLRGMVWPTSAVLWWTFVQAAGSLLGVGMIIKAYQIADASRVSVFEYVILPTSAVWGWIIWDETLGWQAVFGMGLIALAGVLIARQSATASRQ